MSFDASDDFRSGNYSNGMIFPQNYIIDDGGVVFRSNDNRSVAFGEG